jgi:transcription elongation factor Elf1
MGKKREHHKITKRTRELPAQAKCCTCGQKYAVRLPMQLNKQTARQIAQKSDTCSSCYLEAGAAAAAPKAKSLGLPELVGTPPRRLSQSGSVHGDCG